MFCVQFCCRDCFENQMKHIFVTNLMALEIIFMDVRFRDTVGVIK